MYVGVINFYWPLQSCIPSTEKCIMGKSSSSLSSDSAMMRIYISVYFLMIWKIKWIIQCGNEGRNYGGLRGNAEKPSKTGWLDNMMAHDFQGTQMQSNSCILAESFYLVVCIDGFGINWTFSRSHGQHGQSDVNVSSVGSKGNSEKDAGLP